MISNQFVVGNLPYLNKQNSIHHIQPYCSGGRVVATHFLFLPDGKIVFACVEQPGVIRFWWWNNHEERWKYLNFVNFNTEVYEPTNH